jgi:hypothetical protein
MWNRVCAAVLSILLWNVFVSSTLAHSPYFGQRESISHRIFGNVQFAVLYGDGIFFADPSQVVVFDNEGYLLAATPQSEALLVLCDSSHGASTCRVYDELRGLVFEPDYEQWARGRVIEKEGKPLRDAYPEYMDIEYGFTQRSTTFMENITVGFGGILKAPVAAIFAIMWWSLAWSFIARLAWHWKRNGWAILPLRASAVAIGVFRITAFLGMSSLAAYTWLLEPYSFYYFFIVFMAGALLAAVLTRPREAFETS